MPNNSVNRTSASLGAAAAVTSNVNHRHMIEKLDAMPSLLNACPSFEDAWQAHLREFGDEAHYVAAGEFAHHLLRLFQANELSTFAKVGGALERLVVEGSPFVQGLAVVGVLEGIQNVWSNNQVDPEVFFPYLGHASGKAWKGLDDAWSGLAQ